MSHFEDFHPKLKPCVFHAHAEGSRVVVEETATLRHYVLPQDSLPILKLLDGTRSVREIVMRLHQEHVHFRFGKLVETIEQLRLAGFLKGDEPPDPAQVRARTLFDRGHAALNRLRWSRVLLPKLEFRRHWPPAFYALAVILIGLSLLSLWTDNYFQISNTFGSYRGSYWKGMGLWLLASSFLMSTRSLCMFVLQLLATGRCYGLSLRLVFASLHLGVTDSAIYFSPGRRRTAVFHLASLCSLTAIAGLLEIPFGHSEWYGDLRTIAIFLTLLELSPYLPSDLQKLFRIFQPDELVVHLIPYLKNRSLLSSFAKRQKIQGEFHLAVFASFALAWSMGALWFCLLVLERNYPNQLFTWGNPDSGLGNRLAALVECLGLLLLTAYFFFDAVATLARNLYDPVRDSFERLRERALTRSAATVAPQELRTQLRANPLFEPMTDLSLDFLISNGWVKEYRGGTRLILQGSFNHALFAILSGKVAVIRRESSGTRVPVAELGAGAAVGEVSAIHDRPATADVIAQGQVRALVIHKKFLQALGASGEGKEDYERMVGRVMLSHFLSSSTLFNGLPLEIIHVFANEGRVVTIAPETVVTEQGSLDKTFYLLVHGEVDVWVDGTFVKRLRQGEFFGEIALIDDVPRTATVKTVGESVLLRIEADVFWKVLSANIRLSVFIERVAELRAQENRLAGKAAS